MLVTSTDFGVVSAQRVSTLNAGGGGSPATRRPLRLRRLQRSIEHAAPGTEWQLVPG